MLVNTLKSNQPYVIVLIIFVSAALWLFSFVNPIGISISTDTFYSPFYSLIVKIIEYKTSFSVFLTLLIVVLQAFLLVFFNKTYILINYRTYLPAFFYIIIASSFVQLQRINPVILGAIFIFISINNLFSIYRSDYTLNKLYLAGFFIAIASLFWTPFIFFVILIWISLLVLRPFIGREWLVGLLGFLTPYLFVFVYYFVFTSGDQIEMLIASLQQSLKININLNFLHFSYYILYGFLFLLLILASYTIIANFQKKKIRNRKYFEINWWIFFISFGLLVFFESVGYEIIYVLCIPLSFLLTDYFYTIRKSWFLNLLLVVFYLSIIYIQITAHQFDELL